jgi:hypothetical protein
VAEISAFRGLRYNLEEVGDLGEVFAPPYDVIDAAMRDELIARNEYNVARLTRSPEAESEPEETRYSVAAALLAAWRNDGVLELDEAPSLYVCEQEFKAGGKVHRRLGLTAASSWWISARGYIPTRRLSAAPSATAGCSWSGPGRTWGRSSASTPTSAARSTRCCARPSPTSPPGRKPTTPTG